jgi:ribosomal protein S18 acetylase RimI-like enzyme
MRLVVRPLTERRWQDLETIFSAEGCSVARGCWCMYYRESGRHRELPCGETLSQHRRKQLRELAGEDPPPGLIGYSGRAPVGWISLGPRSGYAKLQRSPIMRPVDDEPVWSIICFVVPGRYRGQGVAIALLDGAIKYAQRRGVRLLEAYPVDKPGRSADDTLWFGTRSMYEAAGFNVVARRKATRPVMRRMIG